MDIDVGNLLAIIVFSTIGLAYFVYGKKQADPLYMLAGLALMAYGYFTDAMWVSASIGAALTFLPHVLRRFGS